MTLVASSGPPRVRMWICPKDSKARIMPITVTKSSVGDSMGKVTCRNVPKRLAPSMRALS
jgi:hypothetical protein